jgi:hypothetical protein
MSRPRPHWPGENQRGLSSGPLGAVVAGSRQRGVSTASASTGASARSATDVASSSWSADSAGFPFGNGGGSVSNIVPKAAPSRCAVDSSLEDAMRIKVSSAAVVIVAVFMNLVTVLTGVARADEFPGPGEFQVITRANPSWIFGDENGTGSVQNNFSTNPNTILLGYKMSARNIALCAGAQTLNESITLYDARGRVVGHDSHVFEACDYQAHPAFWLPDPSAGRYTMKVRNVFRVVVDGAHGTATLDATANFEIRP